MHRKLAAACIEGEDTLTCSLFTLIFLTVLSPLMCYLYCTSVQYMYYTYKLKLTLLSTTAHIPVFVQYVINSYTTSNVRVLVTRLRLWIQRVARAVRALQVRAARVHGRRAPDGLHRALQARPAPQAQPPREQVRAAHLRALAARPHHLLLPEGRRALTLHPSSSSSLTSALCSELSAHHTLFGLGPVSVLRCCPHTLYYPLAHAFHCFLFTSAHCA